RAFVARTPRRTAATLVSTGRLLGPHALVLLQDVIPATRPFSNSGPPESPSHVFEPPRSEFQQSRRPACWSDSGQSARCTDPTSRCAICPRPSRPKPTIAPVPPGRGFTRASGIGVTPSIGCASLKRATSAFSVLDTYRG